MNNKPLLTLATLVPFLLAATDGSACVPEVVAVTAPVAAPQEPGKKPVAPPKLDMNMLKAFFGSEPPAPKSDNKVTDEKAALGRLLYHEKLSKTGDAACSTCHDLTNHGINANAPVEGQREALSTVNAYRQFVQFWDGRAATVEDAVHGLADDADLVGKIKGKPELVEAFAKAFGEGDTVTAANAKLAIGAFARKLAVKTAFDEFLDGKNSALTTPQKIGLKTFIDVGCTACHTTRLMGGQMYQKLGVTAAYPSKDEGRFEVTKNEADKKMFKVTSLINVAKTAPYMHDGAVKTLPETVALMAKIQLNRTLKDDEVASIVTFLEALSGDLPEGTAVK